MIGRQNPMRIVASLMRQNASPRELLNALLEDDVFLSNPLHVQILFDLFIQLEDELSPEEIHAIFDQQNNEGETLGMHIVELSNEEHDKEDHERRKEYFKKLNELATEISHAKEVLEHLLIEDHYGQTLLHKHCGEEGVDLLTRLKEQQVAESRFNHLMQKQDHDGNTIIDHLKAECEENPGLLLKVILNGFLTAEKFHLFHSMVEDLVDHCNDLDEPLKSVVHEHLHGDNAAESPLYQFIQAALHSKLKKLIKASNIVNNAAHRGGGIKHTDSREAHLAWLRNANLPAAMIATCLTVTAKPAHDTKNKLSIACCLSDKDFESFLALTKACVVSDNTEACATAIDQLITMLKSDHVSFNAFPINKLFDVILLLSDKDEHQGKLKELIEALKGSHISEELRWKRENVKAYFELLTNLQDKTRGDNTIVYLSNNYWGLSCLGHKIMTEGKPEEIEPFFAVLKFITTSKERADSTLKVVGESHLNSKHSHWKQHGSILHNALTSGNAKVATLQLVTLLGKLRKKGASEGELQALLDKRICPNSEVDKRCYKDELFSFCRIDMQLLLRAIANGVIQSSDYHKLANEKNKLVDHILTLPPLERVVVLIGASTINNNSCDRLYSYMSTARFLTSAKQHKGTFARINQELEDGILRREDNLMRPILEAIISDETKPELRKLIHDKLVFLANRNPRVLFRVLRHDAIPHDRLNEVAEQLPSLSNLIARMRDTERRNATILSIITPTDTPKGLQLLYANAPEEKKYLEELLHSTLEKRPANPTPRATPQTTVKAKAKQAVSTLTDKLKRKESQPAPVVSEEDRRQERALRNYVGLYQAFYQQPAPPIPASRLSTTSSSQTEKPAEEAQAAAATAISQPPRYEYAPELPPIVNPAELQAAESASNFPSVPDGDALNEALLTNLPPAPSGQLEPERKEEVRQRAYAT